jgi:glutathione synthase/RimK-type ligase-like ATP-grasp enzyme
MYLSVSKNKKKKLNYILILNNSHSESGIIKCFLKLGYKVITVGAIKPYVKNKNLKHYKIDFTNIKKIKSKIIKYNIKFVMPSANDLTVFSAHKISRKFIDNLRIINLLHNKLLFRKFYKKIKFQVINDFNKIKINFPYLLKPIIGSGGKGIVLVKNKMDLLNFKVEKEKSEFIAEEYIKGSDHGVFTLIKNKKIVFIFFDSEQRYINPFTVSSTSSVTNLNKRDKNLFFKEASQLIKKLNLINGILHFQTKFNANKKFFIIEVTRRIPGDMYLRFVSLSLDITLEDSIINLLLKNKNSIFDKKLSKFNNISNKFIIRKVLMAPKNGRLNKIQISNKIKKNIVEKHYLVKIGEKIENYMDKRIGIVFLKFKTQKELELTLKIIDNLIKVKIYD